MTSHDTCFLQLTQPVSGTHLPSEPDLKYLRTAGRHTVRLPTSEFILPAPGVEWGQTHKVNTSSSNVLPQLLSPQTLYSQSTLIHPTNISGVPTVCEDLVKECEYDVGSAHRVGMSGGDSIAHWHDL